MSKIKDGEAYIGQLRRIERRKWLYQYLLENPCVDCGERDPVVLEFDHRGDKQLMVSAAVNRYGLTRLKAEVDKCDVRCSNCHKRKTAIEQRWTMARLHYSI